MRRRELRIDRQRSLVVRQSLVEAAQLSERIGEIVVRPGKVRLDRQRSLPVRRRLVEPAQFVQRAGEIVVRFREVRHERHDSPIVRDRFLDPALLLAGGGEIVVRDPELRIDRQRLLVPGGRLVELSQGFERIAEIELGLGVVGLERHRLLETRDRLGDFPLRAEHNAEIVVRLGEFRLERDRAPDEVGRILAAQLMRKNAEEMPAADVIGLGRADLPVQALGLDQPSGSMVPERNGELFVGWLSFRLHDRKENSFSEIRLSDQRRGSITGTPLRMQGCPESFPWLFASRNPLAHLGLECRRAEGMPFPLNLVEKRPPLNHRELFEPIERLGPRLVPHRHRHIDRQASPGKIAREQDQVGLVGPHPFRQRTVANEPAADELAARILRPRRVDGATLAGAERARLSAIDLMPIDFDLEPTVTAGRAGPALSLVAAVRVLHHFGSKLESRGASGDPGGLAPLRRRHDR